MKFSKHHKTIKVILAISFFILLPIACKKEKVHEPTFCEQNPDQCAPISEAKDFFLFKMGSWWVYEEETSKVRDSVYVTEYSNTETYDFEACYYSQYSGYYYHFFPYAYAGGSSKCDLNKLINSRCLTIARDKTKPGNFVAEDFCFYVYYSKNTSVGTINSHFPNNRIYVKDIYYNYSLQNLNFEKTVIIYEDHTIIENDQRTNHYYSKGVGLIRKELLDSNQVWNLINYHIEK